MKTNLSRNNNINTMLTNLLRNNNASPADLKVFEAIASQTTDTEWIEITPRKLMKTARVKPSTYYKSMRRLIDWGAIETTCRGRLIRLLEPMIDDNQCKCHIDDEDGSRLDKLEQDVSDIKEYLRTEIPRIIKEQVEETVKEVVEKIVKEAVEKAIQSALTAVETNETAPQVQVQPKTEDTYSQARQTPSAQAMEDRFKQRTHSQPNKPTWYKWALERLSEEEIETFIEFRKKELQKTKFYQQTEVTKAIAKQNLFKVARDIDGKSQINNLIDIFLEQKGIQAKATKEAQVNKDARHILTTKGMKAYQELLQKKAEQVHTEANTDKPKTTPPKEVEVKEKKESRQLLANFGV